MNRLKNWISGGVILFVILLLSISGRYVDWLWFKSLGSTSVFWIPLITGPLTKLIAGVIIALFFLVNLWIALRAFDRVKIVDELWVDIPKKTVFLPGIAASLVLAFILASGFSVDWTVIQQFLHRVPVGLKDPFFHQDLGFYLFSFPFFQQINNLVLITAFLGLAGTGLIYFIAKAFWKQGRSWDLWHPAKIHLTLLTILFLGAKIWGYALGKFGLLYQESDLLTGLNYTAAHARIAALTFLSWFLGAAIVILLVSLFRKGTKLLVVTLVTWIICSFALNAVYPGIIQSWIVTPNEFVKEKAYLKNHIAFTRKAYGLDKIKVSTFLPQDKSQALNLNDPSLSDLRLWDYKPLAPSYNQLQSIRQYYQFQDIDIDRYPSADGQRQIMISARELNTDQLAQTWINLNLKYTHGYGFAANQVNQFSSQGQPVFIARDLPTKVDSNFAALTVTQPQIYFGEGTNQYCIVDTDTDEFDFPLGESYASTKYKGGNGIQLNSGLVKLLMALKFHEFNFLISPQLTAKSRILMYRNIEERVRKLAPFLLYDKDPYLVVSDKKLYWIIDAYTTSTYFPYARPYQNEEIGLNYIRNSVKVVVDAYDGTVNYYVIDPHDPVIAVWRKIFPHLFKEVSALSQNLKDHFRYPEYLLTIQRDMLLKYHMTDPSTFYGQEDKWDVPLHNQSEIFDPYYVTVKPPKGQTSEFVMMQPFTPFKKQNLISWLIARCDGNHYGELNLEILPKDQTIYGPAQIDSRINQDQTISQLVTLWNQKGTKVVWGNLLIIPINNSILYVKPLFMESEQNQQAELKKIVMVYQNQVLMGDTVAEALGKVAPGALNQATGKNAAQQNQQNTPKAQTNRRAEILKRLDELIKEQQNLLNELRNAQ